MLGHCHISMTCYINSRVLAFSVVWIYLMVVARYQLILLIDIKWRLHAAVGSIIIQLYSGLRMHQLIFNVI